VLVREGERAARIVADLLRFARRERPEKRLLGLSGVLLRTLERKSYELKSSRIDVVTDLDPALPLVLGDFHQMQVVFSNLITNAQQAMFDHLGHGTLTIAGRHAGGKVVLTFSDDGPGIRQEHARRVFDPFFTTRAVGQGAGLGLSVCFAIVRDHSGTLRASGKPGGGAVFTVALPPAPPEALAGVEARNRPAGSEPDAKRAARSGRNGPAPEEGETPEKGDTLRRPSGPRVLIAESEADVQGVVLELLETLGYRVDTADSGEAALAKIRGQDYEAVIADFDLPRLEGRRLLDAVQAARPRLARRVIFLASDTTRPHLVEFTATSGNLLLGKPFRLDALRAALGRLFPDPKNDAQPVH